ncbi:MAG: hypothetical protein ABIN80_31065 [Dyadobacter sp.]|uniref:hypothetical protein n=1 Tax=Dyadobacter sp. TaxID=1914288 RepID=UPI003264E170
MQKTSSTPTDRKFYSVVDPELDKYEGVVLFPDKLAIANEVLRTKELPKALRPKVPAEK